MLKIYRSRQAFIIFKHFNSIFSCFSKTDIEFLKLFCHCFGCWKSNRRECILCISIMLLFSQNNLIILHNRSQPQLILRVSSIKFPFMIIRVTITIIILKFLFSRQFLLLLLVILLKETIREFVIITSQNSYYPSIDGNLHTKVFLSGSV